MSPRTTQPSGALTRRRVLKLLVATPLVANLLAACGDDATVDRAGDTGGSPGTGGATTSTVPGSTPGPTGPIEHPTGASDVLLRIASGVGGFTTTDYAFAQLPTLVVGGDGLLVRPGPQLMIYPGPLLPALESAQLADDQVQALLRAASDAGLLAAPPDYDAHAPQVTDVGSTIVTVTAGGSTFVHSAYALGLETETDPARKRLADFVALVTGNLASVLGAEPAGAVYRPDAYAIGTTPAAMPDQSATGTTIPVVGGTASEVVVTPDTAPGDPQPRIVPWPASFGTPSPGTDEQWCVELDGAVVEDALRTADQLTYFDIGDGTVVRVLLRPILPGSDRCGPQPTA